MRTSNVEPSVSDCLQGWKEIATYLERGVRTVQRYEAEFGLPVRRYPGKDAGTVVALKSDIDQWLRSLPLSRSTRNHSLNNADLEMLRMNVQRMSQLRDQMFTLRAALVESVMSLQKTATTLWTYKAARGNISELKATDPGDTISVA